jgi:hypothetical protein
MLVVPQITTVSVLADNPIREAVIKDRALRGKDVAGAVAALRSPL